MGLIRWRRKANGTKWNILSMKLTTKLEGKEKTESVKSHKIRMKIYVQYVRNL